MRDLPELHRRQALRAAGWSDSELRRGRRNGRLARIRRGAYASADDQRLPDPEVQHLLAVQAEYVRIADDAVVSHISAALVHGLPAWGVPLERVHATRDRRTGGRIGPSVHLHTAPLSASETCEIAGIQLTAPARTVVDLARSLPFESAVAIMDASIRAGLRQSDLDEALRRASGWPGLPAARRVASFADGRSESVGESRSRVAIQRAGLPAPTLQWEVRDAGELHGRCDFGWPEFGTVGEFDGQVKYGRLLRPGQDPGEVVFEEKLREDALRASGLHVARWVWRDLVDFAAATARIRRGFVR